MEFQELCEQNLYDQNGLTTILCASFVSEQAQKRRARHLPSSGEVFLLITLTPEPPWSGTGQAIKGLLKHYRYCQGETGDLERNKLDRLLQGLQHAPSHSSTPVSSQSATLLDKHH